MIGPGQGGCDSEQPGLVVYDPARCGPFQPRLFYESMTVSDESMIVSDLREVTWKRQAFEIKLDLLCPSYT